MNIKDFYKTTKQDLKEKTKEFNFTKKQIKKMIDNAKKNGEEINNICNLILEYIDLHVDNYYQYNFILENIKKIKNIVGGNKNE